MDKFKNALDIAKRTLDILLNEVFVNDVDQFLRINALVKQSGKKEVRVNVRGKMKTYRYFECYIIEPDEALGDTLNFSQEKVQWRIKLGEKKASQVLG